MLKLHVGCGSNLKEDYINIDAFPKDSRILKANAWELPYPDHSVDEVLSEHMLEHLSFHEEKLFWQEMQRVLKSGGKLIFEVPDFEWIVDKWRMAYDRFSKFYELGKDHDYFGNGYNLHKRWGYLTAAIFGNQSDSGQFHKNAYTRTKIFDIARMMGFKEVLVENNMNKHHQNIRAILEKL